MPKYLSGRVKRTPQGSLTSDRYQFLGLEQTEPNIGDPPEFDPLPSGTQYQIVSFIERPGERFWVPVGGGIIPGSLTFRDEGLIVPRTNANPNLGVNSITDVDFVGAAVSVLGFINPDGTAGTAVTVTISAPGEDHGVIFNNNGEFATSPFFTFDNSIGIGSVGIGTSNPTQNLHVVGNVKLDKTIYGEDNQPGNTGDLLVKTVTGGVKWVGNNSISVGAAGTFTQVQFHDSTGLLGGASNLVYDFTNNRVGIGSTQPDRLLDVLGDARFTGFVTFTDDVVFKKNVSIAGTLTYEDVTNVDAIGIITARSGIDINTGGLNVTAGITTFNDDVEFNTQNGNNIVFDKALNKLTFGDDVQAMFGNDEDLKIYHASDQSYIQDTGSGSLTLDTNGFAVRMTSDGSEVMFRAKKNQGVELYHNGENRFETSGVGATVYGKLDTTNLSVTGFSTFTNTIDANGDLDVDGHTELDDVNISGIATVNDLDVDGHTELNDLNVSGIATFKDDVEFHGVSGITSVSFDKSDNSLKFVDDAKAVFGNDEDLKIYHSTASGGNSIINDTGSGNLIIGGSIVEIKNAALNQTQAAFFEGSQVDLYHNNTLRLSTSGVGATVYGTGTDSTIDLSTDDNTVRGQIFADNSDNIGFKDKGGEWNIKCLDDAAVELYYNNTKRIETITGGGKVTGELHVTDKIGINETSPRHHLTVNSGTTNVAIAISSTDAGSYIAYQDDTTGDTGTNSEVYAGALGGSFAIHTSGQSDPRVSVASDGKLLIGITASTSNDANLQVFNSSNSTIVVGNTTTSATGISRVDFCPSNETVGARIECHATEDFSEVAKRTADLVFVTRKDGTNSEKLRITSDGDIYTHNDQMRDNARLTLTKPHVGVSTALFLHNSNGDGTAAKISSSKGLVLGADVENNSGGSESFIQFEIDGNAKIQIDKDGDFLPSNNLQQNLGTGTQRWNILYVKEINASGGSIVVDNYETNNLKVSGFSTFVGDAEFKGSVSIGGTLTYEDVTNIDSIGLITARNGIHVTGGNVGIGTDYPDKDLTIASSRPTIKLIDNDVASAAAFAIIDASSHGGILFDADPNDVRSDTDFRFNVDGDEVLRIDKDGKVGIGTDDPDYGLHVYGDGDILIEDSSNGSAHLRLRSSNNGSDVSNWKIKTGSNNYLYVENDTVTGTSQFTIDNSGNVGIRSAAPTEDLEVKGDQTATIYINAGEHDANTANEAQLKFGFNQSHATIDSIGYVKLIEQGVNVFGGDLAFGVPYNNSGTPATREALRIASDGEVGIGTVSPNAPLDVFTNTAATNKDLFMVRSATGAFAVQCSSVAASNPTWALRTFAKEDLVFSPGGNANTNEAVRILSDGDVLVGHSSTEGSGKLQVFTKREDAIDILSFDDAAAHGGRLTFYRNRNTTYGSNTKVQENDSLGRIDFRGMNTEGTDDYEIGVSIRAEVEGILNSGSGDSQDMPSRLLFFTNPGNGVEERLRITGIGSVGIGSTIPKAKLDVVGTTHIEGSLNVIGHTDLDDLNVSGIATFDQIFLPDNKEVKFGNTASSPDLKIYHDGSWNYIDNIGTKNFVIRVNSTQNALVAQPNGKTSLYHSGDERLKTTASGVDITDDLHVAGLSTFTKDAKFEANVSIGGTLTYEDVTNVDAVGLITARSGIHIDSNGIIVNADQNDYASTDANDVVIGTINDNNKGISILGNASTGIGRIMFSDGTGSFNQGLISYQHSDDSMRFLTSTTEKLGITSTGQVQINRDGGNAALTLGVSQDFKLYHDANGPTIFSDVHNQGLKLQIQELDLTEYTGTTTKLKIDPSYRILKGLTTARGNFADNTSGVEYGVQIEGTSAIEAGLSIIRNSNDIDDGGIVIGKTRSSVVGGSTTVHAGDDLGTITFAGADGTSLQFGAQILAKVQSGVTTDKLPTDLIFKTNEGSTSTHERLRIHSTGWQESHAAYDPVGINTFASWARTGGAIRAEVGYHAVINDYMYFGTGTTHPLALRTSNTTALYIDTNQNVGIGTVPASGTTLDIDASGGGVLALRRNSVNTNNKITLSHDGTDGTLESTNKILFRAGGDQRVTIDSDGNLLRGGSGQDIGTPNDKWDNIYANKVYANIEGGFTNTGNVTIDGNLNVKGNVDLGDDATDTLTVTGDATFKNNVSIAGTLTYEDVTNVDSIGIITARSGIHVVGTGSSVGIGTDDPLRKVDVIGNSILVRPTDENVHSSGNADAVNNSIIVRMPYGINANTTPNAGARFGIQFTGANNTTDISSLNFGSDPVKSASIYGVSEDDGSGFNKKVGLAFYTSETDATQEERLRIESDGGIILKRASLGKIVTDATNKAIYIAGGNDTNVGGNINLFGSTHASHANHIRLRSGETVAVEIDEDGKVGIGTTDPDKLLEIYNSSTGGNTALKIHNDKTGDAAQIILEGGRTHLSDCAQIIFANRGNTVSGIIANSAADDGDLSFRTSASGSNSVITERLRVTSGGDIVTQGLTGTTFNNDGNNTKVFEVTGIGVTGQYGQINISGIQTGDNNPVGVIKFINRENLVSSSGVSTTSRQLGSIEMRTVTDNDNVDNDSGGIMRFITKAEGGANAERLRIHSGGNVSIGTTISNERVNIHTASGSKAQVQFTNTDTGTANGDGLVFGINGTEDAIIWNQENTSIQFATKNTERLRITSDGKVKIGHIENTNPTEPLHVVATTVNQDIARFTGANKDRGLVISTSVSGSINDAVINYNADSQNGVGQHVFLTDDSERLRITSDGNVGIGTTIPTGTNAVGSGNTAVLAVGIVTANEYFGTFKGTIDSEVTIATDKIEKGDTKVQVFDDGTDGNFSVVTEGTQRLNIGAGGTSVFTGDVKIRGAGGVSKFSLIDSNNESTHEFGTPGNGDLKITVDKNNIATGPEFQLYMRGDDATDLAFHIDHDRNVTIPNGDVGIGTVTVIDSSANLSIYDSDSSARIYITSDNDEDSSIYFGRVDDTATAAIRYEHSTEAFDFYGYNNSKRLTINSSGGVIIANDGNGGTADVNADNFVVKNTADDTSCGISILNADNQNATLYFGNASDSKHAEIVWSDASNLFLIGSSNAGASIKFRTADQSDALLIDSNGKVGIDVSTPKSRLHLGASQDIRIGGQYGGMASMQQQVQYSSGYTGTHWQFKSYDSISWSFDGVLIVHGTGGSSYGSEVVSIKIVYSRESGDSATGDIWRNGTADYNIETLGHSQIGLAPSTGSLSVSHDTSNTTYTLLKLAWSSSGQNVGVWSKLIGNFYWASATSGDVEIQDKDGNIVFNSNP